jgi:hypothetical protein
MQVMASGRDVGLAISCRYSRRTAASLPLYADRGDAFHPVHWGAISNLDLSDHTICSHDALWISRRSDTAGNSIAC